MAVDRAEQVAFADVRPGGAADVDLPFAAFDRDRAEVFHHAPRSSCAGSPRSRASACAGLSKPWKRFSIFGRERRCCRRGQSGRSRCRRSSCRCDSACHRHSPTACRDRARRPGRSSFLMPSRSMRCPPVNLTSGTWYLSATSAMRRSCVGVVTPPGICGTTENVPSFWMLACTRSLMKRASRSSSYSSCQSVLSSDGEAGFAAGIFLAAGKLVEDRGHRLQAAFADRVDRARAWRAERRERSSGPRDRPRPRRRRPIRRTR